MTEPNRPPLADRRPTERVHHGDTFVDAYEWLRDPKDPDVLAYLEAENAYTETQTEGLAELREAIFTEIKARTQESDLTVPQYADHQVLVDHQVLADDQVPDGPGRAEGRTGDRVGYWYYTRTQEGAEYRIHCRTPAADRETPPDLTRPIEGEEVLLDGNLEAGDCAFFSLGSFSVSPGGRLLAYAVDRVGDERFTIRVKDLSTGELLPDTIENTFYGAEWGGDEHLFYTRTDDAWRPFQALRHRLGTDAADDPVVLVEPDERYWLGVETSRDDRWVLFGSASKLTSEYAILSADEPEAEPRVVAPRRQGVEYGVEVAGDRLLIVHNDGAEDFTLAQAPLTATSHTEWQPVLGEQPGVRILGVEAFAGHAVVSLRRNGLTGLHVIPRDGGGDLAPDPTSPSTNLSTPSPPTAPSTYTAPISG